MIHPYKKGFHVENRMEHTVIIQQVLIRTPVFPLSLPRWVSQGPFDSRSPLSVHAFGESLGACGRGQTLPHVACVPWKLYHTNGLHMPTFNFNFLEIHLFTSLVGGVVVQVYTFVQIHQTVHT